MFVGEVKLEDLEPGMRVLFRTEWLDDIDRHFRNPKMDRWLGQIVTVQYVFNKPGHEGFFTIEEDTGELPSQWGEGWYWSPEIVQEIIYEKEEEFEAESDDAFLNLLNGR